MYVCMNAHQTNIARFCYPVTCLPTKDTSPSTFRCINIDLGICVPPGYTVVSQPAVIAIPRLREGYYFL